AAGATVLLALEYADLDAAWHKSIEELRQSRARIAAAAARERHALERDLHDGAQQGLLALRVRLGSLVEDLAGDEPTRRRLLELVGALDQELAELRNLAHGIYPPMLAELGLDPALHAVAARAGSNIKITTEGVERYETEVEVAVYYCCREALQNAIKHAGTTATISLLLHDAGTELTFEVRDDGPGFETSTSDGAGLRNMRDRLAALNGRLDLSSNRGEGTTVRGAVPLRPSTLR